MIAFAAAAVTAQEKSEAIITAFKDKAVVIDVSARIVAGEQDETWNNDTSKVTLPGRPVTVKLVGSNIVVAAQFTPYKRDDGSNILVAQGQVWVSTKTEGILYFTTMQTIPLEFGERAYFFPLGQQHGGAGPRIEVQLTLRPYSEDAPAKGASSTAGPAGAPPPSGPSAAQASPKAAPQPNAPAPAPKVAE